MRLICIDCKKAGAKPFEDSAPYGSGAPNGVCAEHGTEHIPSLQAFSREYTRDFREAESFTLLPSRRYVGMEFEMFHATHKTNRVLDAARDWRLLNCGISEDGSIESRANLEIKTPPAQGDDAVDWARAIGSICPTYGMKVGKSCGLHVHVDIRDFSGTAIKRLGLLLLQVEPVLYAMLPQDRAGRGMCRPLSIHRTKLMNALSDNQIDSAWWSNQTGRHIGANLMARSEHGTVEFRYHSGTLNAEKVLHWLRICTGLIDAAYSMPRTLYAKTREAPLDFATRLQVLQEATQMPADTLEYLQRRVALFVQDAQRLHQQGLGRSEPIRILDLEMPPNWPEHGAPFIFAGAHQSYCRLHLRHEIASCHPNTMPPTDPWPGLGAWVGLQGNYYYLCPDHRVLESGPTCSTAPSGYDMERVRYYRRNQNVASASTSTSTSTERGE